MHIINKNRIKSQRVNLIKKFPNIIIHNPMEYCLILRRRDAIKNLTMYQSESSV